MLSALSADDRAVILKRLAKELEDHLDLGIAERGTRVAALQTGQVDVAYPGDTTDSIAEQPRGAAPSAWP